MHNSLLECVPNISEGRDAKKLQALKKAILEVPGVCLLNVDTGKAANRTVFTFAGEPEGVVEGAFRMIKKASELIDMSSHQGEHPRMGATDVCPLIPLKNISMGQAVRLARRLGKRVGEELDIPVYLYEFAAFHNNRRNLASIRRGEYEGMAKKIKRSGWKPDFGPEELNVRSGVTAIGARKLLVAFNVNLNTKSVKKARSIAKVIRESGTVVKGRDGEKTRVPGTLQDVKAIGWYIHDFHKAQVSMNLTDVEKTPLHLVFDEVRNVAEQKGVKITGSELVGMAPKQVLMDAGRYFLEKEGKKGELTEKYLIGKAVEVLGLNDVVSFDPDEKIIEYKWAKATTQ